MVYPGAHPARVVTGEEDPRAALMAPWRAESSLRMPAVDVRRWTGSRPTRSSTVFCRRTTCASSPREGEPEEEVQISPELEDDDEVVSEELAEIYLARGFGTGAAAI